MCGWTSVLTLLYITENKTGVKYNQILYKNSGDANYYGDKARVVGYNAIAVSIDNSKTGTSEKQHTEESNTGFNLTNTDKKKLIEIARTTLNEYITTGKTPVIKESELTDNIKTNCGAFISLHKSGALRGCIGNFSQETPLYKVVREMTISSATRDYRFSPVTPDELKKIEIEISVLTPLKKINSIDEIKLGRDGIYIRKGANSGTFLPQVATQTGWNLQEFLGHCARDKAGIGWDGWKDAELFRYEAIIFSENDVK